MPLLEFPMKKSHDIQKLMISKNGHDKFGIRFQKAILQQGFIITSIEEGSPAANLNLKLGSTFISMECFGNDGKSTVLYIAKHMEKGLWEKAMKDADVVVLELVLRKTYKQLNLHTKDYSDFSVLIN